MKQDEGNSKDSAQSLAIRVSSLIRHSDSVIRLPRSSLAKAGQFNHVRLGR
jgi:hypothetical protein